MNELTYRDMIRLLDDTLPGVSNGVGPTTRFDDLDLDSLAYIELAVTLTDEYEATFTEADIIGAGDFESLARVVDARRRGSRSA